MAEATRKRRVAATIDKLQLALAGDDPDLAASSDGIARIEHEIQQNLLQLGGINPDRAKFAIKIKSECDLLADEADQHRAHSLHGIVQREQARLGTCGLGQGE